MRWSAIRKKCSAGIGILLLAAMLLPPPVSFGASAQFKDVPLRSWYCIYVRYAFQHGIMNGTSGNTFEPEKAMTRAMTVQTLYNLAGRPAVEELSAARPLNLMAGSGEEEQPAEEGTEGARETLTGTEPEQEADRQDGPPLSSSDEAAGQEAEQALPESGDEPDPAEEWRPPVFEDIADAAWYADAVNWAARNRIAEGESDAFFAPNRPVTREEFAAFLYRYSEYRYLQGQTADGTAEAAVRPFEETWTPADFSRFSDGDAISEWALAPMSWAVSAGLYIGSDKGTVDPRQNASRAQAATILSRYYGMTDADIRSLQAEVQEEIRMEPVSITISAAGDCTLGRDKNAAYSTSLPAMYEKVKDPGYFFSNVYRVFANDDLTIVNLEGTLTTSTSRANKTFAFKGDPSYVKILTAGSVEAANLANNHSRDYGAQSYTDTIRYTEAAGVRTFGNGRYAVMDVKGVKVGLVGIYELPSGMGCKKELLQQLDAVKKAGAQVIIASFHWGVERSNYPNSTQKQLAHIAVDNGADLVLGHHPHVLQGIEVYKGKNIVYSLANFCFGGNRNPSDKDTMIFQQTFTLVDGKLLQDNVKNVIPCRVSSVTSRNDYRPTILTGSEASRVMGRINRYSKGL